MSSLKIAVAGILLVVVLILVFQNQEPVVTRALFWSFEGPRFLTLAIVFLGGIGAGYVLGRSTRIALGE